MPTWMVDIHEAYRFIGHLKKIIAEQNETIRELQKQLEKVRQGK